MFPLVTKSQAFEKSSDGGNLFYIYRKPRPLDPNPRGSTSVDPVYRHSLAIQSNDYDSDYDGEWSWYFTKFVKYCDKLYPYITGFVIVFCLLHVMIDFTLGISTVIHWIPEWVMLQFFKNYLEDHELSPFVPVWYDIDDFPFDAMLGVVNGFCFLNAVIYGVIFSLSIFVNCEHFFKCRDERLLLIFVSVIMCQMKLCTIFYPYFHDKMILDSSVYLLLGKVVAEFKFLGTNHFTTFLNMIMLMGGCCGLTGPKDFSKHWGGDNIAFITPESNPYHNISFMYIDHLPAWPNVTFNVTFEVPAACCPQPRVGEPVDQNWTALRNCLAGHKDVPYQQQGCAESYAHLVDEYVEPVLFVDDTAVLVVLILFICVNTTRLLWSPITDTEGLERSAVTSEGTRLSFYLDDTSIF